MFFLCREADIYLSEAAALQLPQTLVRPVNSARNFHSLPPPSPTNTRPFLFPPLLFATLLPGEFLARSPQNPGCELSTAERLCAGCESVPQMLAAFAKVDSALAIQTFLPTA